MIQKIPYTCRYCGAKRIAEYDDDCPGMHLEKWLKLICCNRCADYNVDRREITDGIAASCRQIQIGTFNGKKLAPEKEAFVRETLTKLTKRYTTLLCDSLGLTNVWDSDFVNQLFDHPDKWPKILRLYMEELEALKRRIQPSREDALEADDEGVV
jgi:hypothetical protein